MLEGGYIKLYRSLLNWEWYTDTITKCVFLHLLFTVNYEPKRWRGIVIERGQRVVSYAKIAQETHISIQQARTSINHLLSTGELTYIKHPQYSVVVVVNYDKFQLPTDKTLADQQQTNTKLTSDQQLCNKSNKEIKQESNIYMGDFEAFWRAYPKKRARADAEKAFKKIPLTEELLKTILSAIGKAKQTKDWTKDNGQFIPYPATWLNRKEWENVYEAEKEDDVPAIYRRGQK